MNRPYNLFELFILDDINYAISNEQLPSMSSSQKLGLMNTIVHDDGMWQQFNEDMDDFYYKVREGQMQFEITPVVPFTIIK